jgi:hypothetical protein
MVAAMSKLLRRARPGLVVLLALALVLGINGLVGAIHSAHHLPILETAHQHDRDGHETEQSGAPEEPCQLAAAASHTSAIAVEALPVIGPSTAEAQLVPLESRDWPNLAWRESARGRAPPASRPLLS